MADNRNFAALDWLIHEISETLQEARQALEAYVEDQDDAVRLDACSIYIHQVHGSLTMMEFFGAAMLADEMERLTQAMIKGTVTNAAEAQEVLMRGILQFPIYLEQVKQTRSDNPLAILPLLNDLRAVRGESLLSDTKLFVPNLAPAKKISGIRSSAALDNVQFQSLALKLRQMFQGAAAGFIRAINTQENLAYLQKVFQRLHKLTQGTARNALWDICLALVEALETDVLDVSAALKNLLRQLDNEIKILAVYGVKSLNSYTSDELIKNLLYYVARAGKNTLEFKPDSQLRRVYETYQLANALVEATGLGGDSKNNFAGPDSEAMRSVIEALKTELEMVKLALDECLSDEHAPQRLGEAAPVIKRIADTMAVLGLGQLRKRVLEQGTALELMATSGRALSHDELLAAASNIIALENELDGIAQAQPSSRSLQSEAEAPSESDITLVRAQESVLRESRNGLERAKNAIIEYIASQWDSSHLVDVPAILREIRGGLGIIPLPDAARIVDACARYIEEQLLAQALTPEWSKLDSLADAIASVEYYLERLSGGASKEENDILLTLAEESIALLGYGVPGAQKPKPSSESLKPSEKYTPRYSHSSEDQSRAMADQANLSAAYQSVLQEKNREEISPFAAIVRAAEAERNQLNADQDSKNSPAEFTAAEATIPAADEADAVAAELASAPPMAEAKPAAAPSAYDGDDDIDEEIIEIFVEEAGEVLGAIQEFFPRWSQNFEDTKALTEFRRAFHTLKGSGRMVGATGLASLGWSIENMLNRLLDHSIQPSHVHISIIEKVCAILPAMIAAFGRHQANPHATLTEQYCSLADTLARGEMPEELSTLQQFMQDEQNKNLPAVLLPVATPVPEVILPIAEIVEPTAAELAAATSSADSDDDDEALWDIFAGEALTHLQVVEEFILHMEAEAPCYEVLSDEVQRALHTLKGSAYMAGVTAIADLIAPLEKFAKDLRSYQVIVSDDILQLLRDAVRYTHAGLAKIDQRVAVVIPEFEQFVARVNDLHNAHIESLMHQHSLDETSTKAVDPKILSIFMTEELNVLLDAEVVLAQWQQHPQESDLLQPLLNEIRQLTRGARLAGLPLLANLSETMEYLYEHILAHHLPCSDALCLALNRSHIALLDMMDTIAAGQNLTSTPVAIQTLLQEWIAQADGNAAASHSAAKLVDQDILSGQDVLSEKDAAEIHPEIKLEMESDKLLTDASDSEALDLFLAGLSRDASEADAAGEAAAADLPLEAEIETDDEGISAAEDAVPARAFEPVAEVLLPEIEARAEAPAPVRVLTHINHHDDDDFDPEIIEIFIEEALELLEEIERSLHQWQEDISDPKPVEELKRYLHTFKGGARLAGLTELGDVSHNFETLLIEMEDHADINQALFARFNQFQDLMHKGVDEVRVQLVADYAAEEAEYNKQRSAQKPANEAEKAAQQASAANLPAVVAYSGYTPIDFNSIGQKPNVLTFAPRAKPPAAPMPQIPGTEFGGLRQSGGQAHPQVQHLAARRTGPQEVVKVPAQLLEELVNLAGETSISRGRMQQQVMDLSGAIGEMDSTILRLQEQLRRLDIETEAQVVFRQEKMAQREDFDPLEMDRYSQLQQLSRSLMESASDLMDLKYTLADKTRDAETLLLQQSRINTDLQEGLMRSRMVPFSRLVPRLRRIVRQAAVELGKDIDFELDNVEGELDRSMLERMVAPLEHMLRNAVDHGIESAQERAAAGKPAMGRISVSLSREGGDVMLRLSDDGRGINLQRVREKAIERGLIVEDARLSDQDLMQFILHAGFSTADKVTQISGRGVGMDVVHSEIKQLGGAMFIDSRSGEGTEFIIRLPFTVSVNRALMVQIGDDLYAVPLNSIEGIVRVSPFELEHYYQDTTARFDYAGENYLVRYLGTMLDSGAQPKLEGQVLPLPVILVRSADVTVALQVDRLLGSREIVVKTLGAQFSSVQGVSGATVMGDGSVVVILDLHALLREQLALGIGHSVLLEPYKFQQPVEEEQVEKVIMVVDDSVTVRKVTTRFLEREGYTVFTAKDGVEALQLLQDRVPDVMLLDIEMPRMDGFEVAKNIRTSSRLKDLPIIMITSRTGDKHRERALDLGVNKYMGKPYQEDILLANIQELMAEPISRLQGGVK